jgi:cytochrome c oxidase cbb3-type subunit I/II
MRTNFFPPNRSRKTPPPVKDKCSKIVWNGLFFVLVVVLGLVMVGSLTGQHRMQMGTTAPFSWSAFQSPVPVPPTRATVATGRELYLLNCAVCHGDAGKGDGWRARFLYPKPRNFTPGIFRFKTTPSGSLPTDRDLFRTISTGLQGTSMPTWGYYLSEGDRWALVAYLKTFSRYFREDPPGTPIAMGTAPEMTTAGIERGRQLFAKVGCGACHGDRGYGDGYAAQGMLDSFGAPIQPRNFHLAQEFKRGRTLRDIALTVHTGNDGTPMPSFQGSLTNNQAWDLASFIMSLDVEMPTFRGPGCPRVSGIPPLVDYKSAAARTTPAGR